MRCTVHGIGSGAARGAGRDLKVAPGQAAQLTLPASVSFMCMTSLAVSTRANSA